MRPKPMAVLLGLTTMMGCAQRLVLPATNEPRARAEASLRAAEGAGAAQVPQAAPPAEAQSLAEATARHEEEEAQRRQLDEAESKRLAQENHEQLQRAAEQEAQQEAHRQAERQLELERQARLDAEARVAEALMRLESTTRDVKVREEPRGLVLTLSGQVLFASNAEDLLPAARERLTEVAAALKESDNRMVIEGHTDSLGSDAMNEALSYRRAERVLEFLVSQGVSRDRIAVRGLGEYQPIASNGTPEGRSNNRRVEIVLSRDSEAMGGSGVQPPGQ